MSVLAHLGKRAAPRPLRPHAKPPQRSPLLDHAAVVIEIKSRSRASVSDGAN